MDLFLVRHGEAAASWGESSDPGLSALGARQAESAAVMLREHVCGDTQLWSSPLRRAVETAAPLASKTRQAVRVCNAFREIPAPVPLAQRQAWLRHFMRQQWHEQEPGLITWRNAVLKQLQDLQQPAVVYTHFLVINAVVGHVLERTATLSFWPANGSVTRFRLDSSGLELITLGDEMQTRVN